MTERCNSGESNAITPVQTRILIVEDETAIREMLAMSLRHEGFEVQEAADSRAADISIAEGIPDLMLLDWMLPGTSGIEFARRLRREDMTRELPIIMLTARGEENDKLNGFDAGADDYVPKPFSVKELIARINAVLKRSRGFAPDEILETEGLTLDPVSHRVTIRGEHVKVGPTEFRLLQFFMTHPERVYTRGQLLDRVWGSNVYVEERTVDVHIRRLRKLLESSDYDRFVQTVHGTGYRFSVKAA